MLSKRSNNLTTQTLLDFDLEESSSDSDFRIEDHDEDSDDYSVNSKDQHDDVDGDDDNSTKSEGSDTSNSEDESEVKISTNQILNIVKEKEANKIQLKLLTTPICCACLGERSDDTNEIVECDGCGVSVHECCYGVSDSASVSSTVSSCTTEPWFCEACKAGVTDPVCELCPNKGGIYKETDVGKWVHLVCALYIPGVAFGEVDQLTSVTLFEMQYSKWGSKSCSLCEDSTFSRTGVCIGCDAGMCKNYFHVTCAQSNGLLSEAHSEEVDHADPFYAHCKLHSDKTLIKKRKRNFNALKLKMEQRLSDIAERKNEPPTTEQLRIERKLKKHKTKYLANKLIKTEPWVPTQKMPRLLTTSASARRRLLYKAQLMGIDTPGLEIQETQIASVVEARKRWHIAPAFSIEFIAYYLDRMVRLKDLKNNLKIQIDSNKNLLTEQQSLREKYDQKMVIKQESLKKNTAVKSSILKLHSCIQSLCTNKILQTIDTIGRAPINVKPQNLSVPANKPMTVPTAAALKMGVGFPLNNLPGTTNNTGRVLSTQRQGNDALLHDCGICKKFTDQHLLAKCDTCHFYYHLGCLNPPLTRHPKKSKLYGWQCSECDKSDDSEPDITLPKAQRRSRVRYSKDGVITKEIDCDLTDLSKDNSTTNVSPEEISITDHSLTSADESSKVINLIENTSTAEVIQNSNTKKRSKKIKNFPSKKINLDIIDLSNIVDNENDESKPKTPEDVIIIDPIKSPTAEKIESAIKPPPPPPIEKLSKKERKLKKIKKNILNEDGTEKGPISPTYLPQFTSEIITDTTTNVDTNHHKVNRKRKKDKHKSKYSSDSEKSPNKEHKRKHKRKDIEYTECTQISEDGPHPRIKIKFKAIHYPPEESNSTPKFIYVPTIADNETTTVSAVQPKPSTPNEVKLPEEVKLVKTPTKSSPPEKKALSVKGSSPISATLLPSVLIASPRRSIQSSAKKEMKEKSLNCDVCHNAGTIQNIVSCDECRKNYHFLCLDPPVKKSPKRRGYSWHCADCDPTETESN